MENKFPENKGIAEAVKNLFINGVHEEKHMLIEMEPKIEGMHHRLHYVKKLLRDLREKHGMEVKRNRNHGKKHKKSNQPKQMALPFNRKPKVEIYAAAQSLSDTEAIHERNALQKNEDIIADYVKLDDEFKSLQVKYDDLWDSVGELKREIVRLQVIVTYLEGKK